MFLLIRLKDGSRAIATPFKARDHRLGFELLEFGLGDRDPKSIYQVILSLLPVVGREPLTIDEIDESEWGNLFGADGAIVQLHERMPDPQVPKYSDPLRIPQPEGGEPYGKMLAEIAAQLGGFEAAIAVIQTLTFNELRSYLVMHGELSRPYDERVSRYRLDQYEKQIKNNPELRRQAMGF